MKKMICEVCNSNKIRKENGVFVCLECGTEYSIEEAKKLLVEVDDEQNQEAPKKSDKFLDVPDQKEALINVLHAWYEHLLIYDRFNLWLQNYRIDKNASLFSYTRNSISSLELKYKSELEDEDFYTKHMFNELDKYITMEYRALYDSKLIGNDPNIILRNYGCIVNGEFVKEICKYTNDLLNLKKVKQLSPKYTNGRSTSYRYVFLGTKDGRELARIDVGENVLLPGEFIMQLLRQGIKYENLVVYMKEVIQHTGYVTTKRGLFSKPETKYMDDKIERTIDTPYEETVLNAFKELYDYVETVKSLHLDQINFFLQHDRELKDVFSTLVETTPEYEKMFNLPIKYRSSDAVAALIELLYLGRADTWKEALNLYETDKFHANVLSNLRAINTSLGRINSTLIMGFTYLGQKIDMTNSQLETLIHKNSEYLDSTNRIANELEEMNKKDKYVKVGLSGTIKLEII